MRLDESVRCLVVTAASIATLVACTAGTDPSPTPATSGAGPSDTAQATVDLADLYSEVQLPETFRPSTQQLDSISVVAPTSALPGLIVALAAQPGAATSLSAWRTRAAEATPMTLGLELAGTPTSVSAAASAELTAIAGASVVDGRVTPFVATSTDREEWALAPEVGSLADLTLSSLAVHEEKVVAVGIDSSHTVRGVTLEAGEVSPFVIATPTDSTQLSVSGVATNGSDIVVVGYESTIGGKSSAVAWGSTDGGQTFDDAVLIDPEATSVTGVVWTGDVWVATGLRPDAEHDDRPAAWSSAGPGQAWSAEDAAVASTNGWTAWDEGEDATIGSPAVGPDGQVHVWVSASRTLWGSVFRRAIDGSWSHSPDSASGSRAAETAPSGALDVGHNNLTTIVNTSSGWARLSTIGALGWTDGPVLAERDESMWVSSIEQGSVPVVVASNLQFTVKDDGSWSRRYPTTRFGVSVNELDEVSADHTAPRLHYGTGDDGSQVVLGFDEDGGAFVQHRPAGSTEWLDAEVDSSEVWDGFLSHTPEGWVAAMISRPTFALSSGPNRLTILTSVDGSTWDRTPAADLLPAEDGSSRAASTCHLPSGQPVVLGHSTPRGGETRATAWTVRDGAWTSSLPGPEDTTNWFSSCSSTARGVTVIWVGTGTVELWETSDGSTFSPILTLPAGATMGTIETVGGILVAGGSRVEESFRGPVLWLSENGTDWRWLPVPNPDGGTTTGRVFSLTDNEMIVASMTLGGERVWKLADPLAAFEVATPLD